MLQFVLVLAAAAVACYTDVTRRRIPNVLVACLLTAGLAAQAFHGAGAIAESIGILAILLGIGTIAFAARLIGGGDVKFIAAAAATLGWPDALPFILYTLVAGGVLAVAISLYRGRLKDVLFNIRAMLFPLMAGVRPAIVPGGSGSMPYAVAILAGAIAAVLGNLFAFNLRISV